MANSTYASELRALGFVKRKKVSSREIFPPSRKGGSHTIPVLKKHSDSSVAFPSPPWFAHIGGSTVVMDETRASWICEGKEIEVTIPGFSRLTS